MSASTATQGGGVKRGAAGPRLALLVVLLAALALAGRPFVSSDGAVYYALSASLARDGDFDLANQRPLNAYEWRAVMDFRPYGGRFGSIYSGGMALLNFPFLWPAVRLHDDLDFLRSVDVLGRRLGGIPLAYSLAILAASFAYLVLGALFTFEAAQRWVSPWWAAALTLAVMLSLPVVFFGVWEPSYSHTADAFLVALALWGTVRLAEGRPRGGRAQPRRQETAAPSPLQGEGGVRVESSRTGTAAAPPPPPPPRGGGGRAWGWLVLIAAALGLATFVRVMDVVLFVPWGLYLVWFFRRRGEGTLRILGRAAVFALGAAPFAALLLWYNAVSYGHPLKTAYNLQTGYMATHFSALESLLRFGRNVLWRLVHLRYGAVWWAPAGAAAAVGLALRRRGDPREGLRRLCLWACLATVLVMGLWNVRGNRGHGAGPRFFIVIFPFLAVGLAVLAARLRRRALLGVGLAVLTLWSLALQGARISWRAIPRVNDLLARSHPGRLPAPSSRPQGLLETAAPPRERPLIAEWLMYTPFELLRAVLDDSVTAAREPSRAMSPWQRLIRGVQPSATYLAYLAARGRLPAVAVRLTVEPQPQRGLLALSCTADRPTAPGTEFVLDVFEFDRERERRGRRWGRFVSEALPSPRGAIPGLEGEPVQLTAALEVETGNVRLFVDGGEVGLAGHRLAEDHADVLAEAAALEFTAALRSNPPTLLEQATNAVASNPWRRGAGGVQSLPASIGR